MIFDDYNQLINWSLQPTICERVQCSHGKLPSLVRVAPVLLLFLQLVLIFQAADVVHFFLVEWRLMTEKRGGRPAVRPNRTHIEARVVAGVDWLLLTAGCRLSGGWQWRFLSYQIAVGVLFER